MNNPSKIEEQVTELPNVQVERRCLDIEFMYLDLNVCTRCRETDTNLEEAISEVAQLLRSTGVEVAVRKIHIQSEEQARKLRFLSSPTVRINGRDIQLDVKESLCESCGDVCRENVDCRVWTYQGKEYTAAPRAMIIEAIFREVYGGSKESSEGTHRTGNVPDNLKRFFAAKGTKKSTVNQNKDLPSKEDSSRFGHSASTRCCG